MKEVLFQVPYWRYKIKQWKKVKKSLHALNDANGVPVEPILLGIPILLVPKPISKKFFIIFFLEEKISE